MQLQLSNELNDILSYAREEAMRLGNYIISTDHLILGMIRHNENITIEALASLGANMAQLKAHLEEAVMAKEPVPVEKENMVTLSKGSENALKVMFLEARSLKVMKPDSSHLLLAILRAQDGHASKWLEQLGITYSKVKELISNGENTEQQGAGESPERHSTGENFGQIGNGSNMGPQPGQDPHMQGGNDSDGEILEKGSGTSRGDGSNSARQSNTIMQKMSQNGKTPVLDSFGYDLTKAAMEDKLDPVVGREKEIERLAQILGRRKKNNPVLIGEPGVGKSAIAEGLAIRIAKKEVSRVLIGKRVVSLDIGSIVAGTKYRGQFEERMKAILNELGKNPNIILFIDEMHTLVGAGGAAGSLDAANMLKPALARGEIQCIGATTLDEFRQFIEKDGALERRFQKVIVEATNYDQTLDILEKIKERYQKHHNVVYSDEAIKACISLSQRYITDRCLPDKAIDIMDEAGSRVHLKNIKVSKKIQTLEKALEIIIAEKQEAVVESDFERAAMYRDIEKRKRAELDTEREKWQKKQNATPARVTAEDVAAVLSMATNIPVSKIAQSEGNKLASMSATLRERIIGQDGAVDTVTRAIQRNRAGLKDPNKPIGTFLFLGPTGVGKTQLAKVLAQYMFDSPDSIIRIDMSEYMEKHAVSRLIGAPPGYVGYNEGGQLSERVRRKPYSVVLLDEIEKAHPDIFNLLLQVLDEGRLTDSNGRHIDFRNTVLILTSNIGTKELKEFGKGLGFSNVSKRDTVANSRMIIEKAIKKAFTPEFLNRLDEQILFNPLTREDIEKIIDIELKELYERVSQAGFTLKLSKKMKKFVADAGFDPQYGARPLKRAIQRYIEDPLAEKIISGEVKPGETIKL